MVSATRSSRDAQAGVTRGKILQMAAEIMYRVGYQATGINDILKALGLSKGALYHHFGTKLELGYAVIDELFAAHQDEMWGPLLQADNPLQAMIDRLREAGCGMDQDALECGCPINNLAQEMSPLDEGFRQRLEAIYQHWRTGLTEALLSCQVRGLMTQEVDAADLALMLMATIQGAVGLMKNAQSAEMFAQSTRGLVHYLESLQLEPLSS